MPTSPPRPCRGEPGCLNLTKRRSGRCDSCERLAERRRGSAAARGYDAEHERMRTRVLAEEPVCRICERNASTIADHRRPLSTARDARERELLKQRTNYQGVCQPCHDKKRATEDKDWSRPTRSHPHPRSAA